MKQVTSVLAFSCVATVGAPTQTITVGALAQTTSPAGLIEAPVGAEFDGVYRGNSRLVSGNRASCYPGHQVDLDVHNGQFALPWHQRQAFGVKVAPDGTFYAVTGGRPAQAEKHMTELPTLDGRIGTAGLMADYGTRWCRYRLEASQSPDLQHFTQRAGGISTKR